MRMSCNGCRVLRKGCSESCILRPCLHWISTAESQANATIFLAKFYGRAGLTNLISNGPEHLRPAIFRSLLYEACGRMVNPVHGSVGLAWSGNWAECQAGVDSILRGSFLGVPQGNFMFPDRENIVPMKPMAVPGLRRSVKARGRLKGLWHAKPKRKEGELAVICNHIHSSSISDDGGDVTNAVQNSAENGIFNEKFIERYSTSNSGQEHDELLAADEAEMEYCHDLCNLKATQPEAAYKTVGLELTLGSQCSTSPADNLSAV